MNRKLVRWGILTTILLTVTIGQADPLKFFNPFAAAQPSSASAAVPADAPAAAVPTIVVTPVVTPVPSATPEPTASPTSSPLPSPTSSNTPAPVVPGTLVPTPTDDPTAIQPTATTVPTATPQPTPPADIPHPPLAPSIMDVGSSVQTAIDTSGGTINTPDGRISITFPPAAMAEPLTLKITRLDPLTLPPVPGQRLVTAWRFEAFATNRAMAPVDQFPATVTLRVRNSSDDLIGREKSTLGLLTLPDNTDTWVELASSLDSTSWVATAQLTHFSTYGEGTTGAIMAPYIQQFTAALQAGTAQTSIPITVPPGPGGLTPHLALTYDSGLLDSMQDPLYSIGSWVGEGWDLTTGRILVDPPQYPGDPSQYTINGPTGDGRLVTSDGVNFTVRDNPFLKITLNYPQWTVTDKTGTKYIYGGTNNSDAYAENQIYVFDLREIDDIHGNSITYTYQQVIGHTYDGGSDHTGHDIVRSSYPQTISYDNGANGHVTIQFNASSDQTFNYSCDGNNLTETVRYDTPAWITSGSSCFPGLTPEITETRKLDSIDVLVDQQPVRHYSFTYQFTQSQWYGGGQMRNSGEYELQTVSLLDETGANALFTSSFTYTEEQFGHWGNVYQGSCGYLSGTLLDRPYLTQANNGFGGATQFAYHEQPDPKFSCSTDYWTRETLSQMTLVPGGGQPNQTTTYNYNNDSGVPSGPVYFNQSWGHLYRGFSQVKETDSAGNYIKHYFFTTGSSDDDARTGKEQEEDVYDANGVRWSRTVNTWTVNWYLNSLAYFVHLDQVLTYPNKADNSTVTETDYQYDTAYFGDQTMVTQKGLGTTDANQQRVTQTFYQHPSSTDPYIVVPEYQEVYSPSNPNTILAQTNYYYDGATSVTAKPTYGNLTAVSKQITGGASPTYSTTYYAYYSNGNKKAESAARSGLPSGSCDLYGNCIPGGGSQTITTYDPTYNTYPTETDVVSAGDAPTQTTLYGYNYVLGVVTSTTYPSGDIAHIDYDSFGRPTEVWDNSDTEANPTKSFQYHWGASLNYNYTTTWQETTAGSANKLGQNVCYDGFGRQVQTRTFYRYTYGDTVQATVYNSRGLVASTGEYGQAYPSGGGCADPGPSEPWTTTTYDPLGNVQTVTNPDGTSRSEDHSSLTAVSIDENSHKTTSTRNGLGEAVSVSSYTGTTNPYPLYAATSYGYDPLGNLTSVTDPANNQTTMGYDMLGRKTSMADMDMSVSGHPWSYQYDAAGNLLQQTDANGTTSTMWYDSLNRLTAKSNAKIINSVTINWRWRQYTSGSTAGMYVIVGANGQSVYVQANPFTTTSTSYVNGSYVLTTNPITGARWTESDVDTMVIGFKVSGGSPTITQAYVDVNYTENGQTQTVSLRPALTVLNQWEYQYPAGRTHASLINEAVPDDDATYIESSTANRIDMFTVQHMAQTVTYTYDSYDDQTFCTQPTSTALGQMTKMVDLSGTTRWCYDARGNVVKERKTVDGVNYDVATTYDSANRPGNVTYPDGEVVSNSYDDNYAWQTHGKLSGMSSVTFGNSYFSGKWYMYTSDRLQLSYMVLGASPQIQIDYSYDNMGRVTGIYDINNSIQNLGYTYDNTGNVHTITDSIVQPAEVTTFTYDEMNRLKTASGGYNASYGYNPNGTMYAKSEQYAYTLTYPNAGQAHPHAATSATSSNGGPTFNMTYDANGNMTVENSDTFTYNGDNQLIKHVISGGVTITYTYDGQGNLVKKSSTDGTSTIYIGGVYEKHQDGSWID